VLRIEREVHDAKSNELRYKEIVLAVTSATSELATPKRLLQANREHWGIENGLHWVLDVAFNEDRMRQRDRNGIENVALLNRLAVSLLRQDTSIKAGVKCKRKTAGWNEDYLLHLLFDCA
jgi:hypothetical protein